MKLRLILFFYDDEGTISSNHLHQQVLDKLTVERERGITVKAQVSLHFLFSIFFVLIISHDSFIKDLFI